jgi:protein disulfide-isomerase A1
MFKVCVSLLLLTTWVSAEEGEAASDVFVLTDDNADGFFKENPAAFVEFYAPWCGHCKKLAPTWEQLATSTKQKHDGKFAIAKADVTVEKGLGDKYGIQSFPTLKLVFNGKVMDYEGPRELAGLEAFVASYSGPAVKKVTTLEKLVEHTQEAAVTVVYFENGKLDAFFDEFASNNRALEGTIFVQANKELAIDQDFNTGEIVLYKSWDNGKLKYEGKKEEDAFLAWLKDESLPPLAEIGPGNYKQYMAREQPMAWLFVSGKEEQEEVTKQAKAVVEKVAIAFKGKVLFVFLDGDTYGQMVTRMGHTGESLPVVTIEDKEGKHFLFEEGTTLNDAAQEKLTNYVQDFLDGKLTAHVKSEAEPEKQPGEDGVHVLTGNNINQYLASGKDLLMEFYAPWCGHCKKLVPEYEKLAKHINSIEGCKNDVVIAKMDATANDPPPSYNVNGFPTIKFLRAGAEKAVDYDGGRDAASFVKYLQENAKNGAAITDIAKG